MSYVVFAVLCASIAVGALYALRRKRRRAREDASLRRLRTVPPPPPPPVTYHYAAPPDARPCRAIRHEHDALTRREEKPAPDSSLDTAGLLLDTGATGSWDEPASPVVHETDGGTGGDSTATSSAGD